MSVLAAAIYRTFHKGAICYDDRSCVDVCFSLKACISTYGTLTTAKDMAGKAFFNEV